MNTSYYDFNKFRNGVKDPVVTASIRRQRHGQLLPRYLPHRQQCSLTFAFFQQNQNAEQQKAEPGEKVLATASLSWLDH